ncbi:DNA mismatch repair endonuclease MutL [Roseivirga sp. BDSF3-8]|uniref:DNA mismatch repair endonuclease MutL n=1 Tax=Roseivirga sp. BDSF3-8 TaxID=3241598 RepID=UPI003531D934
MSDIIRLLPDALANQIAAGEVVQRPSSVLKELLENAIDAKSTQIQVIIKDAGKSLIQVTDNGIGMSETDARLSFERHATSKIRETEDLFRIRTMGFRGEALASIAAVAQVEMKSRRSEDELGTCIAVEGSEVKKQEPVQLTQGTTISVKNLFFNVPARRNFLKSNPVEMRHLNDEFQRVALANPEVSLSIYHNDLEIYNLPGGKLSQRIVGLFGKNYREQLVAVTEDTTHLNVHGYIGKPEFSKKTRGEQFFFVNNRYIKNNYLNHAVVNAFEGLMRDDHYPFYVLYIEIDPTHIDINVHPTKTEIKFDDERTVYGVIRAAVKQALGTHNIAPSLDFDQDVNFSAIGSGPSAPSFSDKDFDSRGGESPFRSAPREVSMPRFPDKRGFDREWQKLYEGLEDEPAQSAPRTEGMSLTLESAANRMEGAGGGSEKTHADAQVVFQIHRRYICTQVKSGIMLIDQQPAHERIMFEKYLETLSSQSGASQQSLFPQTVTLNPSDFSLVMELSDEIHALGFSFEPFGHNALIINGVPADVQGQNEKELFEGLIDQYKDFRSQLSLDKYENLARSMAKRAAVKPGQTLQPEEMRALIDQLFACSNPNYSPDGGQTFALLSMDKIGSFFNA